MAILLGGIAIIICFLPSKKEKVEEQPINNSITENDKILSATTLSSFVLHVGKAHIQQQFWNRKP
jgi:preprotein translocase subunit YajC